MALQYRPALNDCEKIRKELANVYRRYRNGEIPKSEATGLTYILQTLHGMQRDADVERKVDEIHDKLKELEAITHVK